LALNFLLVARIEKLLLCPNAVVFPQFSHFAISNVSFQRKCLDKNEKVVYHNPYPPTRVAVNKEKVKEWILKKSH